MEGGINQLDDPKGLELVLIVMIVAALGSIITIGFKDGVI